MYGTMARLRVKAGAEQTFERVRDEYAGTAIPGMVRVDVLRSDTDAREFWLAVVFESKEAYRRNADSPEQHQRYERMRATLESDPEWHDGEVVFSSP